jgi:hypothetical protein
MLETGGMTAPRPSMSRLSLSLKWMAGITLLACGASAPGCATTWAAWEIGFDQAPLRDGERTETVPMPGVVEHLTVGLELARAPAPPTAAAPGAAADPLAAPELHVRCAVTQTGRETVYTAATEYGPTFKKFAAVAVALEAAGAAIYFLDKRSTTGGLVAGGVLGADALATGALLLVPKTDRFQKTFRETTVPVRRDCPPGVTLDLFGQPVAVSQDGAVDADGQRLFEQHMLRSPMPVRVRVGNRAADVYLTRGDRCLWAQARHHAAAPAICAGGDGGPARAEVEVRIDVAPGTLLGPSPSPSRPRVAGGDAAATAAAP